MLPIFPDFSYSEIFWFLCVFMLCLLSWLNICQRLIHPILNGQSFSLYLQILQLQIRSLHEYQIEIHLRVCSPYKNRSERDLCGPLNMFCFGIQPPFISILFSDTGLIVQWALRVGRGEWHLIHFNALKEISSKMLFIEMLYYYLWIG